MSIAWDGNIRRNSLEPLPFALSVNLAPYSLATALEVFVRRYDNKTATIVSKSSVDNPTNVVIDSGIGGTGTFKPPTGYWLLDIGSDGYIYISVKDAAGNLYDFPPSRGQVYIITP